MRDRVRAPVRLLVATAALLLFASPLLSQQPARLDPALVPLLRPAVQAAAALEAQVTGEVPERWRALGVFRAPQTGELRLHAFAWLDASAEVQLAALGARIRTRAGPYRTLDLPLSGLSSAIALPGLRYLEASARSELELDVSAAAVRASELRQRDGDDFVGLTGEGALVGLVDTGLDYTHPDFLDPQGRTRVRFLWDQTGVGAPPGAVGGQFFGYGYQCLPASLDARTCPQRDRNGHGTHVAGIAAGDGSATGGGLPAYRYVGIAPEAGLIVVKGGDATFTETGIVDGVAYIFARAAELGLPVAVNISLGSSYGPHDGTRLYERMLDSLAGPGRLVVKSAGNAGSHPNLVDGSPPRHVHAMGTPGAADSVVIVLRVPSDYQAAPGANNDLAFLDLWYEGKDSLGVKLVRPDGSWVAAARGASAEDTTGAGAIFIDNASGGPSPLNGDVQVSIQLFDADPARPPAPGDWRLVVTSARGASAPFHVWLWLTTDPLRPTGFVEGWTNSYLVTSPGNARRAITVGAFSTKLSWRARDGQTYAWTQREQQGDIATFSSPGPTRDGRRKPDLAAPGKGVVSALSSQVTQAPATWWVDPDTVHWILSGTSMSAPHVTGAVALMLQLDPGLDPERVRSLLAQGAARDAFTGISYATGDPGGYPNLTWGAGKLDVRATVDLMPVRATLAVQALQQPAGPVPVAGPPVAAVRFALTGGGVGVRLETLVAAPDSGDAAAHVDAVWLVADENGNGLPDAGETRWGPARFGADGAILTFAEPRPSVSPGVTSEFLLAATMRPNAPRRTGFSLRVTSLSARPVFGSGAVEVSGLPARGGVLRLVPPEITIAELTPADAPPPGSTLPSRSGQQITLAGTRVSAGAAEGLRLTALAVRVTGRDPKAALRLFRDVDGDRAFGAADALVAERKGALVADTNRIVFDALEVSVPRNGHVSLLVVVELGGHAPNGTRLRAALEPASVVAAGSVSAAPAERVAEPPAIAGTDVRLTLLEAGERYALSANPVRGEELIINYAERPRRIRLLALTGEVVAELADGALEPGRAVWRLENRNGAPVANGLYVLALEFEDQTVLEKIMVLRRGGGGGR